MSHQFPSEYYTKTTWKNEPDTSSPIEQGRLNHIEQGIKTADERIYNLDGRIGVYEDYEDVIQDYVDDAGGYAEASQGYAQNSANSATQSSSSATLSGTYSTQSSGYAKLSESYARGGTNTRQGEDTDNSKYYKEQAESVLAETIKRKGAVAFSNLPTTGVSVGDGYEVTNAFTTDSRFEQGSGTDYPANTLVYWTSNNKWTTTIGASTAIAINTSYDNTTSGLSSTNVQDAIDEVMARDLLSLLHPVGTIIESTTCATMSDVVATYGGTTWIQHTGYILRGATSGVTDNSATSDGGSDDAVVVSHDHTNTSSLTGSISVNTGSIANVGYGLAVVNQTWYGTGLAYDASEWKLGAPYAGTNTNQWQFSDVYGHAHGVTNTLGVSVTVNSRGESGTGKNVPAYKNVYIWERTV